jgi:hypothetical protein
MPRPIWPAPIIAARRICSTATMLLLVKCNPTVEVTAALAALVVVGVVVRPANPASSTGVLP